MHYLSNFETKIFKLFAIALIAILVDVRQTANLVIGRSRL